MNKKEGAKKSTPFPIFNLKQEQEEIKENINSSTEKTEIEINWDLLPNQLVGTVRELAERQQIAEEHALNEIMALTTLYTSTTSKVYHPLEDTYKNCNNYYITIAESGDRKSSTQAYLLKSFYEDYKDVNRKYIKEKSTHTIEYEKWKKRATSNAKEHKDWDIKSDPEPIKPIDPNLFTDDATQEGLISRLDKDKLPILGIWSGEGGTFFSSVGMNQEHVHRLYYALNKLWSNEPVSSTRVKHKGIKCIDEGSVVSLNLAMQESVFYKHVATENNEEIGFTARLLICKPRSLIGTRLVTEEIIEKKKEKNTSSTIFS